MIWIVKCGRAWLWALLLLPALASAETRFVTDTLEVTLRTGEGTNFSIVRLLRSGAPLELLETNTESGYSRVRTTDGVEGWIITRYLMPERAARDLLAEERSRSAALGEQLRATREQLTESRNALSAVEAQLNQVGAEREQLQTALDDLRRDTADTLAIARQNRELRQRQMQLTQQLRELNDDNQRLADESARQWFGMGAGVMLVGILLGILVTRIRWRRRRRWEDL